jgi:hypothetical protein
VARLVDKGMPREQALAAVHLRRAGRPADAARRGRGAVVFCARPRLRQSPAPHS